MKTKMKTSASIFLYAVFYLLVYPLQSQENKNENNTILQSFVESYKTDPMARSVTFGIAVGDDWWHVISERKEEGYKVGKKKQYTFHNYGPNEVTLHQGKPKEPT